MAITATVNPAGEGFNSGKIPGAYYDILIDVTAGSGDYLAGGYAFGIAQMPIPCTEIDMVQIADNWRTAAGGGTTSFVATWDYVNKKVQAYGMAAAAGVSTGLTEIANAAAGLNGLRCTLWVRYR